MRARKRAYVRVVVTKTTQIRNVVFSKTKPETVFASGYYIGPFKTNAAAELVKCNPDKYKSVTAAEEAVKRIGL